MHCKKYYSNSRIPWKLSLLILRNTHLLVAENFLIAHTGFFLSPAQKSVPGPAGVQNSGLRNEILHHPSIILEISWKFSGSQEKPGNCTVAEDSPITKFSHRCWFPNNTNTPDI
jgi:hypothetical protein